MCGEWVLYFQYKPMIGTGVTTLILEINRLQFRHFVPLNKKNIFSSVFFHYKYRRQGQNLYKTPHWKRDEQSGLQANTHLVTPAPTAGGLEAEHVPGLDRYGTLAAQVQHPTVRLHLHHNPTFDITYWRIRNNIATLKKV